MIVGRYTDHRKQRETRERAARLRSERIAAARAKGTHTKAEWTALVDVLGGCVRCGAGLDDLLGAPCKDHIVPVYQGGCDCIANIQPMCRQCNSSKGPDDTDHRPSIRPDWSTLLADRLSFGWDA